MAARMAVLLGWSIDGQRETSVRSSLIDTSVSIMSMLVQRRKRAFGSVDPLLRPQQPRSSRKAGRPRERSTSRRRRTGENNGVALTAHEAEQTLVLLA